MPISQEAPEVYFKESLEQAFAKNRVRLLPESQAYLTFLLTAWVGQKAGRRIPDRPLAFLAAEANSASCTPFRRVELYRTVGDTALVISGLWPMSARWKPGRDPDYLSALGARCYGALEDDHFAELAEKFIPVRAALMELSCEWRWMDPKFVLFLCEMFAETRSPRLEAFLRERGLNLPVEQSRKYH